MQREHLLTGTDDCLWGDSQENENTECLWGEGRVLSDGEVDFHPMPIGIIFCLFGFLPYTTTNLKIKQQSAITNKDVDITSGLGE